MQRNSHLLLWIFSLLTAGSDRIEANVSVEAGSRGRENAVPSVWGEAFAWQIPIAKVRIETADDHDDEDHENVHDGQHIVDVGGHFDAKGEEADEQEDDQNWQRKRKVLFEILTGIKGIKYLQADPNAGSSDLW